MAAPEAPFLALRLRDPRPPQTNATSGQRGRDTEAHVRGCKALVGHSFSEAHFAWMLGL